MSNAPYQNAYDLAATSGLGWLTEDLMVVALDLAAGPYTFDAGDEFRSDLSGVITTASVTGATLAPHPSGGAVADAADVISGGLVIPPGETLTALVLCHDTGSAATDTLLFYWDQDSLGNPFERIGDGTLAPVVWANGVDRVFSVLPMV